MYLKYKERWNDGYIVGDNDLNIGHRLLAQEKKKLIKAGKKVSGATCHPIMDNIRDTFHYSAISSSNHECVSMDKYLQNVASGDKRLYLFIQTGYIICPICKELFSMSDRPLEEGCVCGQKEFVINKDAKMRQYSVLEKIQSGAKIKKKVSKYLGAGAIITDKYTKIYIDSSRANKAGIKNYIRLTVEYTLASKLYKEVIETECTSSDELLKEKNLYFVGNIIEGPDSAQENFKTNIKKMLLTDNMNYSSVKGIDYQSITDTGKYRIKKDIGPDKNNKYCYLKIDDYFVDNFKCTDTDKYFEFESGNNCLSLEKFDNFIPYYKEGLSYDHGYSNIYFKVFSESSSKGLDFSNMINLLAYTPKQVKELVKYRKRIECINKVNELKDFIKNNPNFISNNNFTLKDNMDTVLLDSFLIEYSCITSNVSVDVQYKSSDTRYYAQRDSVYVYKDINELKFALDTFSITNSPNVKIDAEFDKNVNKWIYKLSLKSNSRYTYDAWNINGKDLQSGFILKSDIPKKIKNRIMYLSDDAKYILFNASPEAPIQASKFFNKHEVNKLDICSFYNAIENMVEHLESKHNKENISLLRQYLEHGVTIDNRIMSLLYIKQSDILKCGSVNVMSLIREALLQDIENVTLLDLLEFRYNAIKRGDILATEKLNYSSLRTEHDFYMGLNEGSMTLITTDFDYAGYKPLKFKYETDIIKKEFTIVNPENYKDIIQEATTLRHCLRNYISKVSTGDHMILFVRENVNKPLYTISVDKSGFIFHSGGKWMEPVPTFILIAAQQAILNSPDTLKAIEQFYK